jgi:CheY-like chemotaxis protein
MNKTRILIVDDEVGVTRLVKLNLERRGPYEVRTENNGAIALATAREFRPDLIILDVVMPNMDGGEIAAQIQADPELKHVPMLFLTAIISKQDHANGPLIRGGIRFIAKPITLAALVEAIEETLAQPPAPPPPGTQPPAA